MDKLNYLIILNQRLDKVVNFDDYEDDRTRKNSALDTGLETTGAAGVGAGALYARGALAGSSALKAAPMLPGWTAAGGMAAKPGILGTMKAGAGALSGDIKTAKNAGMGALKKILGYGESAISSVV